MEIRTVTLTKPKIPLKKILKGAFSPDLQLSQSQRRHPGSAGMPVPAPCWTRGELRDGRLWRASIPPTLLPSQPAANPALLHGESQWQLLAHPGWCPYWLWAAVRLCQPSSAYGCCEGTPTQTWGVFAPLRWKESPSFNNWAVPNCTATEKHTKLGNTLLTLISVMPFCLLCFLVEPLSQIECRTPFY